MSPVGVRYTLLVSSARLVDRITILYGGMNVQNVETRQLAEIGVVFDVLGPAMRCAGACLLLLGSIDSGSEAPQIMAGLERIGGLIQPALEPITAERLDLFPHLRASFITLAAELQALRAALEPLIDLTERAR